MNLTYYARQAFGILIVGAASAGFVGLFYNTFAYLPDDGAYGYIAQRMLAGDVLNGTIQDIHAGFINFINAFALSYFGDQLVSMRLPLAGLTVIQSCLIFWLLRQQSLLAAITGAVAFSTLTFVQFLNPTANWYSLFGALLCVAWLSATTHRTRGRYLVLGALLGLVFLTRQLSGVILAVGAVTFIFYESGDRGSNQRLAARVVLLPLLASLGWYVYGRVDIPTFLLFASWPLASGLLIALQVRMRNLKVLRVLRDLAAGALVVAMPLLLYHLFHGTLSSWLDDTIGSALRLTQLDFVRAQSLIDYIGPSVVNILSMQLDRALNGVFWLLLIFSAPFLGVLLLRAVAARAVISAPPLMIIASFYALTAIHYQIPTYLFYSAALTLTALVTQLCSRPGMRGAVAATLVLGLSAIGVGYHAGQPPRTLAATLDGDRVLLGEPCDIARMGLTIEVQTCSDYRYLLGLIERHADSRDTVLALPVNPELNYLSARRSPLRFFNAALGIANDNDLRAARHTLQSRPPAIVFFRPQDKYSTPTTVSLMTWVRANYALLEERAGFEVYVRATPD